VRGSCSQRPIWALDQALAHRGPFRLRLNARRPSAFGPSYARRLARPRSRDPGDWIDDQITDIRKKARGMAATSG
jgi:hypothetical protein